MRTRPILFVFITLLVVACGSNSDSNADAPDTGSVPPVSRPDGGPPAPTGPDAAPDAPRPGRDAGRDSAADSGGTFGSKPEETALDLVYRTVSGKSLAADLYLPARTAKVPAVVQIHGGGFATGDKAGKSETTWAAHLVANGFAAYSINYRVYDDFPAGTGAYPGALHDVKCSIMYLRSVADQYGIDKERIFVLGGSAGGYFTNMVGTTGDNPLHNPPDCGSAMGESNAVRGVVTYFGLSDFNALFSDPARAGSANGEKKFLNLSTACTNETDKQGICTESSPITYVGAATPSFFLAHSADDPVVPVTQSRLLNEALTKAGRPVVYREVDGQAHGWHAKFNDATVVAVRDAVVAWLKDLAAQ